MKIASVLENQKLTKINKKKEILILNLLEEEVEST